MASVELRSPSGLSQGRIRLDDHVFGIKPNVPVMHQVVTAQLAAARSGTQSTKTRAEVSGGGRKPWRQKGSGRARQGSTRAPHWRGGGVALGPKPRTYKQRTPKKMIQLALHSALSDRAASDRVVVVDAWSFDEPKTKDGATVMRDLGLTGQGKVLLVLERDADSAIKSFRNLRDVQLCLSSELNAYDVLCNDWVVFTRSTLPGVTTDTGAEGSSDDVSLTKDQPSTEDAGSGSGRDWDSPLEGDE